MTEEPFGLGQTPEEVINLLNEEYTRSRMKIELTRHSIKALFTEVSKDQLLAIRQMLELVQNSPNMAHFLEGMAAAQLETRFNVCSGCGVDHLVELLEGEQGDRGADS